MINEKSLLYVLIALLQMTKDYVWEMIEIFYKEANKLILKPANHHLQQVPEICLSFRHERFGDDSILRNDSMPPKNTERRPHLRHLFV